MLKKSLLKHRLAAPVAIASTLTATLLLTATPAPAQSKIPDREQSYCMATLTAETPGSRINLRSGPSTNYQQQGYGLAGDRVHMLRSIPNGDPNTLATGQDGQGFDWYRVGFPKSGARGWIRADFLMPECFN